MRNCVLVTLLTMEVFCLLGIAITGEADVFRPMFFVCLIVFTAAYFLLPEHKK